MLPDELPREPGHSSAGCCHSWPAGGGWWPRNLVCSLHWDTHCPCRNNPLGKYLCYLATIWEREPHVMLVIISVCKGAAGGAGCSLCELTFCSTRSAHQMNRGAGEPLLPGRQRAGAGRETLLCAGSNK